MYRYRDWWNEYPDEIQLAVELFALYIDNIGNRYVGQMFCARSSYYYCDTPWSHAEMIAINDVGGGGSGGGDLNTCRRFSLSTNFLEWPRICAARTRERKMS